MLNSGPPELPGLIATSVWMNGTKFSCGSERPFGADDAGGDGIVEAERRADRQHPFADPELVRIAELDRRQAGGLDLEQRHVGAPVGADHPRLEFALVGEPHRDLVGRLDHVRIGEDVAVGADDEPRAERAALEFPRSALSGSGPGLTRTGPRDEAPEKIVKGIILVEVGYLRRAAALARLRGADIDDRRTLLFREFGEIRQLARLRPHDRG